MSPVGCIVSFSCIWFHTFLIFSEATFFVETTLAIQVVIQFYILKDFDSFPLGCLLLFLIWKSFVWLSRRGMQPAIIWDALNTSSGCLCTRLYSPKSLCRGSPSVWNSYRTNWPSGKLFSELAAISPSPVAWPLHEGWSQSTLFIPLLVVTPILFSPTGQRREWYHVLFEFPGYGPVPGPQGDLKK